VIGVSFTMENLVKGGYENTVGRVTEWLSSGEPTAEEIYAQQVAEAYGQFLHTIPWFEFPFPQKLKGLWTETGWWGPNIIRKWERKLALSLEYGVKSIYARLIKGGNEASFEPVDLEIYGWAEGVSDEVLQQEPDLQVISTLDENGVVLVMPRYEAFTLLLPRLAQQGIEFVEIAGNDEIMLTIITAQDWNYDLAAGELLFEMPILSGAQTKRVVINVPVTDLHLVLNDLQEQDTQLEHIYDY